MRELEGHVAIVTGSARNIGRAIAKGLAESGAAMIINARRSKEEAEAVAAEIVACGGRARAVMADVSRPEGAQHLIAEAVAAFGRIDVLVNNAAVRMDSPVEQISVDEWRTVVANILDTSFFCSQAAVPHLKRNGSGAIINIGGVSGHAGVNHRAHVSAAKAGVAGLTRALAAELASAGITVNCVAPGRIETIRSGELPAHFRERPTPLGRGGRPDEVAAMVQHLAGPGGRFITGQIIHVNGGWHMA
jgi:3-oxoacyl-[acyl-carrier protein] reductase